MKLVFAGTPAFAAVALEALIAAGHEIALAFTQPDRPSGRGMQVHASAVKLRAQNRGIAVVQPRGLRLEGRYRDDALDAHQRLRTTSHDAMIVAAYGLILPQSILEIPRHGCINIHASLLPRWRGAAPIQRAIEAGDTETGITIMQMDAGLDTGPVLFQKRLAIEPCDTAGTLTDKLALLGGEAIVEALALHGELAPSPQHAPGDESEVRYAAKVTKGEAALDFALPTRVLVDRIRAFDPWPGCTAQLIDDDGGALAQYKVWRAQAVDERHAALPSSVVLDRVSSGRVLAFVATRPASGGLTCGEQGAVIVKTGDGAVALTELQKAGGKRLPARAFARDFEVARSLHFTQKAVSDKD
jgi:methionyl-tRNA formyltransferase